MELLIVPLFIIAKIATLFIIAKIRGKKSPTIDRRMAN